MNVARDNGASPRPWLIYHWTWTLPEYDNLDVHISNEAVSIILDLLFIFLYRLTQISTVYALILLVNFWMIQNHTPIVNSSSLLNGDDFIAKKVLIWSRIDRVRAGYFLKIMPWSFYLFIINLDLIFVASCRGYNTVQVLLTASYIQYIIQSTLLV